VIDVFGDFALIRHVLVVVTPDEPDRRVRNTSVWRRDAGGRWLCIHNHEDLLA